MVSNALSLFKANDPYEKLISNMIMVEREPQQRLKADRSEQERLLGVLGDADSKLSALNTVLEGLTDPLADPFAARAASTSSDSYSVVAGDSAALGSHSLQVLRLAKADTRVSNRLDASATSLRTFFDSNGAQTFTVSVASPTDADPTARQLVDVTVAPTGTTDAEILSEIVTAVNDAMATAVDAGTIDREQRTYASVVNETSDTARLSLRSGQTGFSNRLEFTDSPGGLLAQLGLTTSAVATNTSGGWITEIGTTETDSALNSAFLLDGLTLYRDTNEVSDAMSDVTIKLERAMDQSSDFSIDTDADSIKGEVEAFIEKYNGVLSFIAKKSAVDPDTDTRGDFASDAAFRGLRFGLRNDATSSVSGQPAGSPTFLSEIGITTNDDGTLTLSDEEKLLSAVANDATAVRSLFSGPDGVATKMSNRVDRFLGIGGLLDRREDITQDRIDRLSTRIENWDDRLARREEQLREQFARVQEALANLQAQQREFNSYFGF